MNVALWLERAGRADPERPAIGEGRSVVRRYGELAGRTARLAAALRGTLGLRPGDRTAIIAKNCPDYVEALYAIWWAGLAAVPVNAKLHAAEFAYTLEHSGARVCFATADLESDIAADSHAYLAEVDPTAPGDAILHAAPMSHGSGLYIMPHVMRRGINVVPESGGFDPAEIFESFGHWRRMSMFGAPTMGKRLVAGPAECDASAVRTIVSGGAPMYVEDARAALDRFGPCFAQIYGQGESPMTITTLSKAEMADRDHRRWLDRLGSAGLPYACVEVAVVDQDERPLSAGEAGGGICRGLPGLSGHW